MTRIIAPSTRLARIAGLLYLIPDMRSMIRVFVLIVAAPAEVWMLGYLLVKGARSAAPITRVPAADATPAVA